MSVLPDASTNLEPETAPVTTTRRRRLGRTAASSPSTSKERKRGGVGRLLRRTLAWLIGVPLALLAILYLVLLVTPIPLEIIREPASAAVEAALPPGVDIELGEMSLALENASWPVLRFNPVTYSDRQSGAKISMEALAIGFSPVRALVGQPGVGVTVIGPHIQVVQDLFGPRATSFELVEDGTGAMTVRVLEGEEAFPSVQISKDGVDLIGTLPLSQPEGLRSDNDWLIYNMEAAEKGLRDLVAQAAQGRFSRMIVRDGVLDMNDSVNGVFRQFRDLALDITPDATKTEGTFAASLAGRTMNGNISRIVGEDGMPRLSFSVTNIDFASLAPMLDEPESMGAIRGTGALSADVDFVAETGEVTGGVFRLDMSGTDLRVGEDFYPIATGIMAVAWDPKAAQFRLDDTQVSLGPSSATISGVFALGLDETYGPTIGVSLVARDISIRPNDLAPPEEPFEKFEFHGWLASLYGAFGIDQMTLTRGDSRIASKGRVDLLQSGVGIDLTLAGEGVTADDLKRIWPYMAGRDIRDWIVKSIQGGTIEHANIKLALPVPGEKPAVDWAVSQSRPPVFSLDMVADGVVIKPTDTLDPIAVDGKTRLRIRDTVFTVFADGGQVVTPAGALAVRNAAFTSDGSTPGTRLMEISGDVTGPVPAVLELVRSQRPELLASDSLAIDPAALEGELGVDLVATIKLGAENALESFDYVVNGTLADFGSSEPIQERTIGNGQIAFSATQEAYRVAGTAELDGLPLTLRAEGTPSGGMPQIEVASTIGADDLKKLGLDASEFLSGEVTLVGSPQADGTLQVAIDLEDAGLTVEGIGINKEAGVPGQLRASIKQSEGLIEVNGIDLGFGDVRLAGRVVVDAEKQGLQTAEFSSFALSDGDNAQIAMSPIDGGYAVKITGDQFDLKPILQRSFGLGEGAGGLDTSGLESSGFEQSLLLDVELDRALGFYGTTAYGVDLALSLQGSDMRNVSLQAQLGEGRGISVTSNPTPGGRTMSVAFNDLGSLLRLMGIYARVEGGEGSLVLATDSSQKVDVGEFRIANFALVDEENVNQILGTHSESRSLVARSNKLSFDSGTVNFIRRSDRVEVTNAILGGDLMGGTMRGTIYTDQRQYDLAGTYVPLFGLNSAFGKLPLFGPLLAGRNGEGLIGVTFAVRGPLDKPDFRINPASALVPGAFRELFEFKTQQEQAQ